MTRSTDRPTVTAGSRQGGFTLIEIMVVMAIIALMGQLVMMNIGELIPSTVLDGEAQQLMGRVEFLRSEAQLQGKSYKLELDIDNDRYRMILPPEERLVSEQSAAEAIPLDWTLLDERVTLVSHTVVGNPVQQSGKAAILIDAHGFMADQIIVLRMKAESLQDMVWTVQFRGLGQKPTLVRNQEGVEARIRPAQELDF